MKAGILENVVIQPAQSPFIRRHEEKGVSLDHSRQNLGVVGLAILVIVKVLG